MAASKLSVRRHRAVAPTVVAGVLLILGLAATVFVVGDHAYGSSHAPHVEHRSGNFTFVVHRVETVDVIVEPEYPDHNVTADGEFIVVKVTVTNVSDTAQTFDSSFSTLTDDGVEYGVDGAARRYVGTATKQVAAAGSADVALVFDLPMGAQPQAIVLRGDPFTDGVTVALD